MFFIFTYVMSRARHSEPGLHMVWFGQAIKNMARDLPFLETFRLLKGLSTYRDCFQAAAFG